MERGHRSAVATFYADAELAAGSAVDLDDAAAHHARVRRLEAGEPVRLTNGRGATARGQIERFTKNALSVRVDEVSFVTPLPRLVLLLPVADRDRMLWLAEKCAELALTLWQPVMFERSASVSPRGEGEAFEKKVRTRMISALEQSGGAWLPEVLSALPLGQALVRSGNGDRFLLDRGGQPLVAARPRGAAELMVGPEGGLTGDERSLILEHHGWIASSLGETTLRFETAAVVGVGVLRGLMSVH